MSQPIRVEYALYDSKARHYHRTGQALKQGQFVHVGGQLHRVSCIRGNKAWTRCQLEVGEAEPKVWSRDKLSGIPRYIEYGDSNAD